MRALVPVVDAEVAAEAVSVGVGGELTTHLGGVHLHHPGGAHRLGGGHGQGTAQGGVARLRSFDMERTALLEAGPIKIVVSEYRGIGGNHLVVYRLSRAARGFPRRDQLTPRAFLLAQAPPADLSL